MSLACLCRALAFLLAAAITTPLPSQQLRSRALVPDDRVSSYMDTFARQELEATGHSSTVSPAWFLQEIPRVDLPDKDLEEMYYFRWYSFAKHLKQTPRGWVITEFVDDVPWAGKYNTISAAAGMHLREARWLHNPQIAEQYASFWSEPEAEPRRYSFPWADSVHAVAAVTGDTTFEGRLLPALIRNYNAWMSDHYDSAQGLFWQIDDRDGMEFSGGGSGFRPTINSYQFGDARAIAAIARAAGQPAAAATFEKRAAALAASTHAQLWNEKDAFYETKSWNLKSSGVRELVGYLPWYFGLAHSSNETAWLQLTDPQGFLATFGYTTTERRSPAYMQPFDHECTWNGPVWPFALTQTLTGLSNLLAEPGKHAVSSATFVDGMRRYVKQQHRTLPGGDTIPWIDEDLDPDSGEWIARAKLLKARRRDSFRGRYYNHSGFADLVISGLIGLRPESGDAFTVAPLVDPAWRYYAVQDLPYHGHLLSIVFDVDGSHYGIGQGWMLAQDGQIIARGTGEHPIRALLRNNAVSISKNKRVETVAFSSNPKPEKQKR